jgi:hypothetical protein
MKEVDPDVKTAKRNRDTLAEVSDPSLGGGFLKHMRCVFGENTLGLRPAVP